MTASRSTQAPNDTLTSTSITAPPLPAHRDEWERRLLADAHLLDDIAYAIGGPFHVLYPERVGVNIDGFREQFRRHGVDGVIYYGKKANKSGAVVRVCAEHGAGVDVASVGELSSALANGIRGHDLVVTGPAKSDELLWLATRHGALIAVDDPGELARLTDLGATARVLLRVLPPDSTSRFGMTDLELDTVLHRSDPAPIRVEGFSFHLSGYDPIARAELAAALVDRCRHARALGHPATTISLGGGFGVEYLPDTAWRAFTEAHGPHWFHADKTFDSYYPYHQRPAGSAALAAVLDHGDLAKVLRAHAIRLAVEPGRALLDRAGSTVFRVQGVKTRTAQSIPYQLLTVDGTSLSLSEQWFDSEYLPDPVLWPMRPGAVTPACVGAATCLESDMLSWRRIPLPRPAVVGDLLVYPNTAGYQMDSNESSFHDLPIPPKVLLSSSPDADPAQPPGLRWALER
ncbi:type III PLP-dependent enzyme domain-containing protein [Nocardia elegans]|uniref:Y4yA family PLP-dependent enzyme n=1 Tax=Nocardia elegans TaxID=300029 RepID=UPI002B4B8ECC|nr:Y4yA family PLP-dependent enzyme [Nocardia elegans]